MAGEKTKGSYTDTLIWTVNTDKLVDPHVFLVVWYSCNIRSIHHLAAVAMTRSGLSQDWPKPTDYKPLVQSIDYWRNSYSAIQVVPICVVPCHWRNSISNKQSPLICKIFNCLVIWILCFPLWPTLTLCYASTWADTPHLTTSFCSFVWGILLCLQVGKKFGLVKSTNEIEQYTTPALGKLQSNLLCNGFSGKCRPRSKDCLTDASSASTGERWLMELLYR